MLKKIHLQYFDVNDSADIQLSKIVVEDKHCYATHRNDFRNIYTAFRNRLKPDAKLQTKRPNKVLTPYCDKLNTLLQDLQKNGMKEQIGSTLHEKPNYGTTSLKPWINIRKNCFIQFVFNARYLNSNTGQSSESRSLKSLATQLARANKKCKFAIDLVYSYAHATIDDEFIKLTVFSSGDRLFAFIR